MAPPAYAALQDGDTTLHVDDESQYELSDVVAPQRGQHRPRLSALFMPAKLHRALRRDRRQSETSDSDSSDGDDEKASFDGNSGAPADPDADVEALLKRKSREGRSSRDSRRHADEKAAGIQQPAWARRGSGEAASQSTENNVLKVR